MAQKFSLFDPLVMEPFKCRNRVVFSPYQENMANRDGTVSPHLFSHYLSAAREGAGLVILESAYVARQGRGTYNQLGISEEIHLEGLFRLVSALKAEGAKVGIRLSHAGARTSEEICGEQPLGPSVMNLGKDFTQNREMDEDDLEELILLFIHAAERAEEVDADLIEINGSQQYLLDQCLSARYNNRSDAFGGEIKGRMRLAVEIIKAIKNRTSAKTPISYYFSIHDKLEDGFDEKELKDLLKTLNDAKVDFLHPVSLHVMNKFFDADLTLVEWVNKFAKQPIIADGNLKSPQILKEVMALQSADLFALDRTLFSRPNWLAFLQKKFVE
ncbi:MAG: NADH:flavin oxidoreductase [Deltaproteobacteria bacterium]|nr:NADH:flavin oxidoreductase [Deltaproteobacteria bacterium]